MSRPRFSSCSDYAATRADTLSAKKSSRLSFRLAGGGSSLMHVEFAKATTRAPGNEREAACIGRIAGGSARSAASGSTNLNLFQLLGVALDRMVEAGTLPAARREGAEFLAWSAGAWLGDADHRGPLRSVSAAQRDALAERAWRWWRGGWRIGNRLAARMERKRNVGPYLRVCRRSRTTLSLHPGYGPAARPHAEAQCSACGIPLFLMATI